MPTTEEAWRPVTGYDAARRWAGPQLLVASIVLLLAVAVLLVARRATGALSEPLPVGLLVTTALAVAAWAWATRVVWSRWLAQRPVFHHAPGQLLAWLPSTGLLLIAVGCSFPGARWIDWLVWLPILVADWFWPRLQMGLRSAGGGASEAQPQPNIATRHSLPDAEQTVQHFTRIRAADGRELIRGTLVAQFAAGARIVTLHVAFCPPFERLPQVSAEPADGPEATVKIGQVLTSGARLDVRLPRPADCAASVTVEFAACEGDVE